MKSTDHCVETGGEVVGRRPGSGAPCTGGSGSGAPRVNPRPAAVAYNRLPDLLNIKRRPEPGPIKVVTSSASYLNHDGASATASPVAVGASPKALSSRKYLISSGDAFTTKNHCQRNKPPASLHSCRSACRISSPIAGCRQKAFLKISSPSVTVCVGGPFCQAIGSGATAKRDQPRPSQTSHPRMASPMRIWKARMMRLKLTTISLHDRSSQPRNDESGQIADESADSPGNADVSSAPWGMPTSPSA